MSTRHLTTLATQAEGTVTGLPALLIILAILTLLIVGAVVVVRFFIRKGKKLAGD